MVRVKGLEKAYGSRKALSGVSLNVEAGSCFGLLGPNGAGKSTTISIIVGTLVADRGSVEINGRVITSDTDTLRSKIGYVPQEIALYEELNSRQNLALFGALYGLTKETIDKRADMVLEFVGLGDRASEAVKAFSGGMKRRLNIAVALLHDPSLIILDEPTVGVDPQSRNAIFETLRTLKASGKTLIYTTHYMEEVEKLCDHIAIMDHGKVVAQGTLDDLIRTLPSQNHVVISLLDEADAERASALLPTWTMSGTSIEATPEDLGAAIVEAVRTLEANQIELTDLHSSRATLEQVFLNSTGRSLRDN